MKQAAAWAFVLCVMALLLLPAFGVFSAPAPSSREEMDAFLQTHIAFRDELTTLHAQTSQMLWQQSGEDQVIVGQDGWLFFAETMPDYLRINRLTPAEIAAIAGRLADLSQALAQRGIGFTFLCAPNKNEIYPEYMPPYALASAAPSDYDRLKAALQQQDVAVLDAHALLRAAKDEGTLYYRTDTHWNAHGAAVVYEAFMANVADTYATYQDFPVAPTPFRGDLIALYMPGSSITEEALMPQIPRAYTTKGVMRSLDDARIHTQSQANGLHLLVLRDSFGEALFPYLANQTGDLIFMRAYTLDADELATQSASYVLLEISERNLRNLLESI